MVVVTAVMEPEGLTLGERGGKLPFGVTYRMLDYWCVFGVFGDRHMAPGSGSRRVWTDEEWDRLIRLGRVVGPLRKVVGVVSKDLVRELWEAMERDTEVVITRGPVTLVIRS